jgi:hypothetical protein
VALRDEDITVLLWKRGLSKELFKMRQDKQKYVPIETWNKCQVILINILHSFNGVT